MAHGSRAYHRLHARVDPMNHHLPIRESEGELVRDPYGRARTDLAVNTAKSLGAGVSLNKEPVCLLVRSRCVS